MWITNNIQEPPGAVGFVYKITEKSSGNYYIGKRIIKRLRSGAWNKSTNDYMGSGCFKNRNPNDFDREIISFFRSKGMMSLFETKIIIHNIFNEKCMNEFIGIRLRISPAMKKNLNQKNNEQ
jgi:hypothetical protein